MTGASGGEGLVCFAKGCGEVSLSAIANCKLSLRQCLAEAVAGPWESVRAGPSHLVATSHRKSHQPHSKCSQATCPARLGSISLTAEIVLLHSTGLEMNLLSPQILGSTDRYYRWSSLAPKQTRRQKI